MQLRSLAPDVVVSGQIRPKDLPSAKESGVTLVVNNRPDGESPEQPDGHLIAEAARKLSIEYAAVPVTLSGITGEQVEALGRLLDRQGGKALLYCRSGTRSTFLWALARAKAGDSPEAIEAAAVAAGYSVEPIREVIIALATRPGD